jgi:hypothetical protein
LAGEVIEMTTLVHTKTKITPWDDPEFVRSFEQARAVVTEHGISDIPLAAAEVERLLREAGYPDARVEVDRTVAEALDQVAHWVVTRDG